MNDFKECLAQSHAASDLPFWGDCYRKAFPAMIAMHDHRQDGPHQRMGIDRSVVLDNGKFVWIDEKVRGRNKITGRVYEDVAVEELSNEQRKVPGWAVKPLLCDYIAYAIAPLGRCYLLPVQQLQSAWRAHCDEWKAKYKPIRSQNNGYVTLSWAIPVPVLFQAIGQCLRVSFQPLELEEGK